MKSSLRTRLLRWPKYRLRAIAQSFQLPAIPDQPWLPNEVLDLLDKTLTAQSVYIEYGSGGSTIFALQRAAHVVSVESDRHWLRHVQTKAFGLGGKFEPIYANVGVTRSLGYPVLLDPTPTRLERWRYYIEAPWQIKRDQVDVVLIDGRWRTACALKSLLSAPEGTIFIFDDFARTDEYRGYDVIKPFIEDLLPLGIAVAFKRNRSFDRHAAKAMMLKHITEPF